MRLKTGNTPPNCHFNRGNHDDRPFELGVRLQTHMDIRRPPWSSWISPSIGCPQQILHPGVRGGDHTFFFSHAIRKHSWFFCSQTAVKLCRSVALPYLQWRMRRCRRRQQSRWPLSLCQCGFWPPFCGLSGLFKLAKSATWQFGNGFWWPFDALSGVF